MTNKEYQLQFNPEVMFGLPYEYEDIQENTVYATALQSVDLDQNGGKNNIQDLIASNQDRDIEGQLSLEPVVEVLPESAPMSVIHGQRESEVDGRTSEAEIFDILRAKREAVVARLAETGQLDVITRDRNRVINNALGQDPEFCALRNQMVLKYDTLARSMAWKRAHIWKKKNSSISEVANENYGIALIALIEAANRYEPNHEKGAYFSTFAQEIITGTIQHHERKQRGYVRAVDEGWPAYNKGIEALEQQGKQEPTDKEIAEASGLDERLVSRIALARHTENTVSLENYMTDAHGEPTNEDCISVEDNTEASANFIALTQAFKSGVLDERDKKIITMYYWRDKNQMEIGEELGISQNQISRLHKKAIKKLRDGMDLDGIDDHDMER